MTANFTLMGKKVGMMQIFDEKGVRVVCSVIKTEKHVVSQIKTVEKDGYNAVQLACFKDKASVKNLSKPQKGHFKKINAEPRRKVCESSLENVSSYDVGQEIGLGEVFAFDANASKKVYVDVIGVSKGKGFQGGMKRHNFAGGAASHGNSLSHRSLGSTGQRSTPGRCLPGVKKAGHMGDERVTVENLRIVKIDLEKQLILVKGAIPGFRTGLVYIRQAHKKAVVKK